MEQARNTLQKIVAETLRRMPAEQIPLAAWEFAAGRAVAEKTRAVSFANGVLTIEVQDETWRAQLSSMTPHFISALRGFRADMVERLKFVLPGRTQ